MTKRLTNLLTIIYSKTLFAYTALVKGQPYTGISDEPTEEGIALADQSIAEESLQPLEDAGYITEDNKAHVEEVFSSLLERKEFDVEDTEAGRSFVEAYVEFTHLFEQGHEEESHDSH